MTVGELVETTARAIAGHFGPAYDDLLPSRLEVRKSGEPNDNDQAGVKEAALSAILAVLEVIAKPTEAMILAGVDGYGEASVADFEEDAIRMAYTAMVDALRASVEKEDV